MRALGLVLLALLCGCSRTADEEQCQKLVDKLVDLMADGTAEHVEKLKTDVKRDKISRSQYECMMAAKSLETFAACEK